MAMFHGKTALIKFVADAIVAFTTGWSTDAKTDIANSTVMQTADFWESYEGGFEDATAKVDGNAATERVTLSQLGAEAILKLYIDATNFLSFNALCVGVDESVTKDDVGKITYSFEMDDVHGVVYA